MGKPDVVVMVLVDKALVTAVQCAADELEETTEELARMDAEEAHRAALQQLGAACVASYAKEYKSR